MEVAVTRIRDLLDRKDSGMGVSLLVAKRPLKGHCTCVRAATREAACAVKTRLHTSAAVTLVRLVRRIHKELPVLLEVYKGVQTRLIAPREGAVVGATLSPSEVIIAPPEVVVKNGMPLGISTQAHGP